MRRTVLLAASMTLAVLCAYAAGFAPFEGVKASAQTQERPNIIFVMTDDQDANSLKHMPYVWGDFKASATMFPNATFNYPLCCPSRASILRGQYTHNHNVWENLATNGGGYEKFLAEGHDHSNFPIWLDNAGYQTSGFGKYINQFSPPVHGKPGGFDFYRFPNKDYDNKPIAAEVHRDEQVKDNAVRWLKENVSGGPLMMWVSFMAPHHPYDYDPIYADRFTEERLPKEPSFNEADVSDKPKYVRDLPRLTDEEVAQLEKDHRNRLRGLLTPDAAMRQMVKAVDAAGETDNTYFVFWSDNGWMMGQHRLGAKRHAYLESASFPMIIKGPGVPQGATDKRIVMNQDLAPTFADIADAPAPEFVDGRSLVPIFDGVGTWRDVGLVQASAPLTVRQPTEYRGIRDEDYTYVEYVTGEREYYDLVADPYQLENSYGALTNERKAELAAKLDALKKCVSDDCRTAEGGGTLPAMPTALTATPSASGVAFEWNDNSEADLVGYNVYRADSKGGPFTRLNVGPLGTSSYDDADAPFEQLSHYWVTAVDEAGDESAPATISATRSDTTAPIGTIKINGGVAYTNSPIVKLTLSATDSSPGSGVSSMRLRNENASTWLAWKPYVTGRSWTLSGDDGRKVVRVRYRDKSGNVSATAGDSIRLDTAAPRVKRVAPTEGAMDMAPGTNVTVFFAEAMKKSSINVNTVKLFKVGTSTTIGAVVRYDATAKKTVLNPNANLQRGARYKVIVTTGARDLASNRLDQDPNATGNQPKGWLFTVRA